MSWEAWGDGDDGMDGERERIREQLIEDGWLDDEAAAKLTAERDRLLSLINAPELENFLRGTHIEAVHQVERWGEANDRAKRPADWFWLVGYLAGKALHALVSGDVDKALHHCISTSAALYNWHSAIRGANVHMCPGRSDLAEMIDGAFPGEAPPVAPLSTTGATDVCPQ